MSDTDLIADDESHFEKKWIAIEMEEQKHVSAIHEQRIMQVEQKITQVDSRVTVIEVKQGRYETALEKLTDIVAGQATKTTLTEATVVAMKEGQEQHRQDIRELKRESVDIGKILEQLKSQMNVLKALGTALGAAIVSMVVAHYLHLN